MIGKIIYHERAYPADCKRNPAVLYVFGDNMIGKGDAGQACIRYEPNSIGCPTKHLPAMTEKAFFSDDDWKDGNVRHALIDFFDKVAAVLRSGKDVSFPQDGLGTGLAQLERRAPKIYEYINRGVLRLQQTR